MKCNECARLKERIAELEAGIRKNAWIPHDSEGCNGPCSRQPTRPAWAEQLLEKRVGK